MPRRPPHEESRMTPILRRPLDLAVVAFFSISVLYGFLFSLPEGLGVPAPSDAAFSSFATASIKRRRWPTESPSSLRSSVLSRVRRLNSMSFSTNDSACSPRPFSCSHRVTSSVICTARSPPVHQFSENCLTFVSLFRAPFRTLEVTNAEWPLRVASRRWAVTDGYHRLTAGTGQLPTSGAPESRSLSVRSPAESVTSSHQSYSTIASAASGHTR